MKTGPGVSAEPRAQPVLVLNEGPESCFLHRASIIEGNNAYSVLGAPGLLGRWVDTAAWLLKARGVVTLIWRADALDEVLEALGRSFGDISVLAVLPRAGAPAIRVLVRAMKGGGGTRADYPALALNDESGQPTAAVEAVLREGKTLNIADA